MVTTYIRAITMLHSIASSTPQDLIAQFKDGNNVTHEKRVIAIGIADMTVDTFYDGLGQGDLHLDAFRVPVVFVADDAPAPESPRGLKCAQEDDTFTGTRIETAEAPLVP